MCAAPHGGGRGDPGARKFRGGFEAGAQIEFLPDG